MVYGHLSSFCRHGVGIALLSAMALTACDSTSPSNVEVVQSSHARIQNPDISQDNKRDVVDGNTDFALDLYEQVSNNTNNIFYSPFSISTALTMTWAGAKGQTAEEMIQALRLAGQEEHVHPAFNWLDVTMQNLGTPPHKESSEPFQLSIANATWGQKNLTYGTAFLDTLAENYGAGMNVLDFEHDPDGSRQTINRWVENKTKDRIKNLLPEGSIDGSTRMVLTNAIYFKASWLNPFSDQSTTPQDFITLAGQTVQADMMRLHETLKGADLDTFKVLELPYDGGDVSMVVFLPDDLAAFETTLSATAINTAIQALEPHAVDLQFPKFQVTQEIDLVPVMKSLGMILAFGNADFSGITQEVPLLISGIFHKAFVAVDEDGTEAAAATAVVMSESAGIEPPSALEFHADRPFFFVIRDNSTGTLLFVGRVADPTSPS